MAKGPGKLDQRITFQAKGDTPDGIGGIVRGWANVPSTATVWAHVKAMGGTEAMQADQQQPTTRYLFTVRNRSDISEADRIMWDGAAFNIRRIEREGTRKMYLVIEAERGVAD